MGGEATGPDPGGGASCRRPGGRLFSQVRQRHPLPTPQPRPTLLSEDPAAPGGEGAARPSAPLRAAPTAAPAFAASPVAGYAGWGRASEGKISGECWGLWAGPGSGAGPQGTDLGLDSQVSAGTVHVGASLELCLGWGHPLESEKGSGGGAWRDGLRMPRILKRSPGAGVEAGWTQGVELGGLMLRPLPFQESTA